MSRTDLLKISKSQGFLQNNFRKRENYFERGSRPHTRVGEDRYYFYLKLLHSQYKLFYHFLNKNCEHRLQKNQTLFDPSWLNLSCYLLMCFFSRQESVATFFKASLLRLLL